MKRQRRMPAANKDKEDGQSNDGLSQQSKSWPQTAEQQSRVDNRDREQRQRTVVVFEKMYVVNWRVESNRPKPGGLKDGR